MKVIASVIVALSVFIVFEATPSANEVTEKYSRSGVARGAPVYPQSKVRCFHFTE